MASRVAALAAILLGALVPAPPVSAHEETALAALSVIDSVTPEIEGLSFRIAHLTQPVLIATNRTERPLVVFGRNGEPFLRLGPGGVESNANSPLTYSTRSPAGSEVAIPPDVRLDAPAEWRRVGRGRSWSWFDPRIRKGSAGAGRWTVVAGWGAQKISIVGSFEPLAGHGHFTTTIVDGPEVADLDVRLQDGLVPALYVRNDTAETLHVAGRQGEPFLRIGPRGVFANLESPDYYLGGSQTIRAVPPHVDPSHRPRWRKVSPVPLWTWLELRARLPASAHQRARLGDAPHVVATWSTPMTLGREPLLVRGAVEWRPPRAAHAVGAPEESRAPLFLGGLAALALLALAAWLFRRRRQAAQ